MQKLAELCIKRPVFATMLILALVVMGLNSYMKLGWTSSRKWTSRS